MFGFNWKRTNTNIKNVNNTNIFVEYSQRVQRYLDSLTNTKYVDVDEDGFESYSDNIQPSTKPIVEEFKPIVEEFKPIVEEFKPMDEEKEVQEEEFKPMDEEPITIGTESSNSDDGFAPAEEIVVVEPVSSKKKKRKGKK